MHQDDTELPSPSRRAFLSALGLGAAAVPVATVRAAPIGAAAVPDATEAPGVAAPRAAAAGAAAAGGSTGDDADDMAAAARLAGLEFTVEERQQAAAQLRRQREQYAELRARPLPFELPPCATFDPVPPGRPRPAPGAARGAIAWRPPGEIAAPQDETEIAFATIDRLAAWLRRGAVTSRRLTEVSLARLAAHDPALHCVVTRLADEALATADARDAELRQGTDRGPLHGIPFGAKDLFAWPSAPTTFGAAPFRDHFWALRATVLDRLHEAGAVLTAKLSLGALAMGDLWFGGRTRSPWNPERGSSGSSAGSASAVAAGLVPFALGTETLGSIVSPCRACGIGGLRPTFGAVSRHGAMPLSWTMDKVGPIARSALDLALVFDAIRGADGKDPAARDAAFPFAPDAPLAGLRVGVVDDGLLRRTTGYEAFATWLGEQGLAPHPVRLPEAPYRSLLLMLNAEGAAVFDDLLRAGRLGELPGQGDGDWPNRFRSARCVPAVEMLQASRLRQQLLLDMDAALRDFDVIVAPTHGGDTLTATNLSGHPTVVLPVGADERENGRPTMIALLGALHGEAAPLLLAHRWQQETDWHRRRPARFS